MRLIELAGWGVFGIALFGVVMFGLLCLGLYLYAREKAKKEGR